jgi:glycosyltransferase involved in cell wall biosynthesis
VRGVWSRKLRSNNLDISVIIATYNRALVLRDTLENMSRLDRDALKVEFVVVDNNSSDHTKQVIESFDSRLPIRYLFECRPGKNCALNRALDEVPLGRLVVFTDDDVEIRKDWLKAIVDISGRWPDYSVFGGRIYPVWPAMKLPPWVNSKFVIALGFASHHIGNSEHLYPSGNYPFGGNFWVRREILENGRRFCETIGPRPGGYVMGSETSFLKQLTEEGYGIVYSPAAVVGHRIKAEQISILRILKRAYRHGRALSRMQPLCRRALLDKHPLLWRLIRTGAIVRLLLPLMRSLVPLALKKPAKTIQTMRWIGYNVESLRMEREDNNT